MNRIKYLSSYEGPSYGSAGAHDYLDGHKSLSAGMASMWHRQNRESDTVDTYRENPDGVFVPWELGNYTRFPATSEQDVMWLYYAIPEDGGYVLGDVAYCITVGPRGGIRPEKG